ncbi:hypothetical protein DRO61_11655 [Candidatus Bathyarchaeota archaeon]|nr:MAG: hypothetical protein DRO61_11655 [Candidatus Bathyarchaeota archaeon]
MGAGDSLTAAGVNAVVSKIEDECTRRDVAALGWTAGVGDLVYASEFNDIRTKLIAINAVQCYCEGDGGIQTHEGGTALSLDADDVSVGNLIYWTEFDERDNDIDALDAQCAEVSCTCDGDCTECGCNTHACTCVGNCVSHCACFQLCTCIFVCSCNLVGKGPIFGCTCDGNCQCNSHCLTVCTCNKLCTCVDDCTSECGCNDVCTCEFD